MWLQLFLFHYEFLIVWRSLLMASWKLCDHRCNFHNYSCKRYLYECKRIKDSITSHFYRIIKTYRFFAKKFYELKIQVLPKYSVDSGLLMRSVILIITLANSHDIESGYVTEQSHKVYLIRIRGRRRRWLRRNIGKYPLEWVL